MKKTLKRIGLENQYHIVNGNRHEGVHKNIKGNVSCIRGDVTGIRGDVTGILGDVDNCELTENDRAKGIDIATLCVSPL